MNLTDIISLIKDKNHLALIQDLSSYTKRDEDVLVLVDVSGSMVLPYGGTKVPRILVAEAIAVVLKEIYDCTIYATGGNDSEGVHYTEKVPDYYGVPLANAISRGMRSLGGGGIFLKQARDYISHYETKPCFFVVITDEVPDPNISFGKTVYISLGDEGAFPSLGELNADLLTRIGTDLK